MQNKWIYQDATALVQAIAQGECSSRDLLEAQIQRIEQYNPNINSCVAFDFEQARKSADQADLEVREQHPLGALHGLPMTIKDAFKVRGMPCTDGNPLFRDYMPSEHAAAVQKLLNAGAIAFAKTNVPLKCADIQTYNQIYGTCNNPWNVSLTAGGSSGGAAASLAMGFSALELGSDIGGSIRTPAHFCGVYGYKTTYGLVSFNGHILNTTDELSEPDLAVIGPMARSARDLKLMLDILVQPDAREFRDFQLKECEKQSLEEFKVLFWLDDDACPIDSRMKKKYEELLLKLKQANIQVDTGRPQGWDFDEIYASYSSKLVSQMMIADSKLQKMSLSWLSPWTKLLQGKVKMPAQLYAYARGANLSHAEWAAEHERALHLKQECLKIFADYDLILCPPIFTLAFEHNHQEPMVMRSLNVDGQKRFYLDLFKWIAPATVLGLPTTCAPIGLSEDNLPVNIQIISKPYADKVTIQFASLLAELSGGFQPPEV